MNKCGAALRHGRRFLFIPWGGTACRNKQAPSVDLAIAGSESPRVQEGELDAAAKANSKPLCALVAATGMAEIEGLIRAGHTTRLLPVFIAAITAGNRSFLGSPGARGALTAQDRSGKHQRRR